MKAIEAGPLTFLLVVNITFIIAGMFIDPGAAMLVLVPALFPVATFARHRPGALRAGGRRDMSVSR